MNMRDYNYLQIDLINRSELNPSEWILNRSEQYRQAMNHVNAKYDNHVLEFDEKTDMHSIVKTLNAIKELSKRISIKPLPSRYGNKYQIGG